MADLNLQHKINVPFAQNGDKDEIPDTSAEGLVNNTDGLGVKYETPIGQGGEYYTREIINGALYKVYAAVKEIQEIAETAGFPVDMTKALNVLPVSNGGTGGNNAQEAANNMLKDATMDVLINNTDYVYIYKDNAVKKITFGNLVNKVIPIGFIYIQYRNQSTPDILFGTDGKWQDVSAEYAGEFLRVVGGNSASFGSNQNEGLPNINGTLKVSGTVGTQWSSTGAFTVTVGGHGDYAGGGGNPNSIGTFTLNASRSSSIYGASTHVTPYNSAIRIWKKIA